LDLQFISCTEFIDNKKKLILASIIFLLVIISWLGILDYASYDYLEGSLFSALSSYAVSRTLNGIISVLQSSTLSVGIAAISVGELLDPVNDIVEKFSELLMLSIASIVIQKVLLSIVSSVFFKGLLTFSGLAVLSSLSFKKSPYSQLLIRSFIVLAFFRLSLSLMIILNSVVDNSFLASQVTANYENVQGATRELDSLKQEHITQQKMQKKLEHELVGSRLQREILNENLALEIKARHKLHSQVNSKRQEIERYKSKLQTFDRYNVFRTDTELSVKEHALAELFDLLEQSDERVENIKDSITAVDKLISYNENNLSEKANGLLDNISKTAKYLQTINLSEVKEKLDFIINNLLDLMTLYILKSIILPILFMFLLYKGASLLWYFN